MSRSAFDDGTRRLEEARKFAVAVERELAGIEFNPLDQKAVVDARERMYAVIETHAQRYRRNSLIPATAARLRKGVDRLFS